MQNLIDIPEQVEETGVALLFGASMSNKKKDKGHAKIRNQVAALPLFKNEDGSLRVMLITSRRTRRWIVPKGWTG